MAKQQGSPITSQRRLAAALGRSDKTIREYLRDPRWRWSRAAPWLEADLPAMRRWLTDELAPNPADAEPDPQPRASAAELGRAKTAAQIRLAVERAAEIHLKRLILEGQYVKRVDQDAANARRQTAVRQALGKLAKALRQPLADADTPAAVERILTDAFRALCNHAFGGGPPPPPATPD